MLPFIVFIILQWDYSSEATVSVRKNFYEKKQIRKNDEERPLGKIKLDLTYEYFNIGGCH